MSNKRNKKKHAKELKENFTGRTWHKECTEKDSCKERSRVRLSK